MVQNGTVLYRELNPTSPWGVLIVSIHMWLTV
jgi:hypothetical protein